MHQFSIREYCHHYLIHSGISIVSIRMSSAPHTNGRCPYGNSDALHDAAAAESQSANSSASAHSAVIPAPDLDRSVEELRSKDKTIKLRPPFPLYDDLISLVIPFVHQRNYHTMILLSKQWLTKFKSMKLLEPCYNLMDTLHLIPPGSAIAHHITRADNLIPVLSSHPDLLFRLASILPNAKYLEIGDNSSGRFMPADRECSLPPRLEKFTMFLNTVNVCPPLFIALSRMTDLQSLTLSVRLPLDIPLRNNASLIDFTPLQTLQRLNFLRVQILASMWDAETDESDAARLIAPSLATLIRNNPLTELQLALPCDEGSDIFFSSLFGQVTANAHWQSPLLVVNTLASVTLGRVSWTSALLQEIVKFTKLIKLSLHHTKLQAADMLRLRQLPQLTYLIVDGTASLTALPIDVMTLACQNSPNLLKLEMHYVPLTNSSLDNCLSYLPHLTSLTFAGDGINSLAPFTRHGLPERLTQLEFASYSTPQPFDSVKRCILALQHLENLSLFVRCPDVPPETTGEAFAEELFDKLPKLSYCRIKLPQPHSDSGD